MALSPQTDFSLGRREKRQEEQQKSHRLVQKLVEDKLAGQAMAPALSLTENKTDEMPSPIDSGGLSEAAFNKALQKMIAASGGKITVKSGKRSTARQQQLWDAALKKYGSPEKARKWVAPPGRSNHEKGLAADLAYADAAARAWAHQKAKEFGLIFPLGNEPWHIEPLGARGQKPQAHGGHSHGAQPARAITGDPDLDWIISKESSGKTTAKNPTSSAFGLGQLIRANRVAYAKKLGIQNPDTTDYNEQLRMMAQYVKDRYGSAKKAREFWQRKGWY